MMESKRKQVFYQVAEKDNVATAIADIGAGEAEIIGSATGRVIAGCDIGMGHKIAVKDITKGDGVIKYGARIAVATRDISAGEFVHLHNCISMIDDRSSTFDVDTGTAVDREYLLYVKE